MRRVSCVLGIGLVFASAAMPQGRPVDWPSYGGDARRTGWERSDIRITKDNIKDFQLVLKRKLEGTQSGARSSTPPVVIGLLISYKGFKELGFVTNSSGDLWALDVDLNRVFWKKRLEGAFAKSNGAAACSGIATMAALTPPVIFGGRRPPTPGGAAPSAPAVKPAPRPARVGGSGFGAARSVFVMAGDGVLHQVNSSDGSDQFPALHFLPAGAKASNLTMNGTVIYAATSGNCGSAPNAVWAIDLADEEPKPAQFALNGGEASGLGGFAVGNDGTVYVQTGPGQMDPSGNKWANTLLALNAKDLKLKSYFTSYDNGVKKSPAPGVNVATPVVFDYQGRDLVASAGSDGRLYLFDSQSVGGEDHKTALHQTPRIAADGGGIWGGLSTWQDADNTRWLAVPVWGPIHPELKSLVTNGPTPNGAIVAFKVEEQTGKPVLTPAWVSRDLISPVPPVTTSGVVFALSTGQPKNSGKAVMYALDGVTGKEMYSTGEQVHAPGSLTGMAVANGRVYFTTADGTLYAFGIFLEI